VSAQRDVPVGQALEEAEEAVDDPIVPLLVQEKQQEGMLALLEQDEVMVVWWATPVECTSAICRRERDGSLTAAQATV
jgi:hypothetical protein